MSERGRTPKRTGIERSPCARSKSRSWQAYSTSNPPTQVPIASAEQPRLPAATAAHGQPAADRRNGHRQAQEQLRPGREALRQRVPEHDRRARPATARSRSGSAATSRTTKTPTRRPRTRSPRASVMAPRGSSRVAVRGFSASKRASTSAVESHRGAAAPRPSRRESTAPSAR